MIKRILLAAAFAMAVFSAAHAADAPTVRLCTGGEGFPYNQAGNMIAQATGGKIKIAVETSAGSLDNVHRSVELAADDPQACDAIIAQPDAVVYAKRQNKALPLKQIAQLHREYLHVLCSKESGVDDIKQLPGGKDASGAAFSVNIGVEGSGAWAIWQNFVDQDASYKDVPTKNEPDALALGSVSSGDTTCMLISAGLENGTMKEANDNYSDTVVYANATDWDFNDATDIRGKPLYEFVNIPRTYTNLQGFFGGKRETVSWLATVYVNPERIPDQKTLGLLVQYINRAKSGVVDAFGK